jgi:polyhydroxyalkanoate synthesis regulator phasin
MKKLLIVGVACGLIVLGSFVSARAGDIDILVDKLVKKGVLTKQEATEVIQEVQEADWKEKDQERAEVIKGTKDAIKKDNPTLFAGEIPEWVRKMQLKGDLRLRYESFDRDIDDYKDRDRFRYRLRLGVVTKINEKMDVGFGFASGSEDPRSTNATYGKEFSKSDIRIDYAYARYKPFNWATLVAGKFENPLWRPTDTFWDSDIHPDGIAAQFAQAYSPNLDLFLNTGWFIIDELPDDENDPSMFVFQPGSKIKFGPMGNWYFKNAFTWFQSNNVENHVFKDYSSKSNTLNQINEKYPGTLKYDFNCYTVSGEIGAKLPYAHMPFIAAFGEYEQNTVVSSADTGYVYGFKIGHEKIEKLHDWLFSARYARLERDAWLDFLPDSDTYDGRTNVKGTKFQLQYGLMKNVWATATYFDSKLLSGGDQKEDKFQFDLNWKF